MVKYNNQPNPLGEVYTVVSILIMEGECIIEVNTRHRIKQQMKQQKYTKNAYLKEVSINT